MHRCAPHWTVERIGGARNRLQRVVCGEQDGSAIRESRRQQWIHSIESVLSAITYGTTIAHVF